MKGFAGYMVSEGGRITGPFTPGQIWRMWTNREITASAQVRADCSERWENARALVARWAPGQFPQRQSVWGPRILFGSVILALLTTAFGGRILKHFVPSFRGSRTDLAMEAVATREREIRQWVEKTFGTSRSLTYQAGPLLRDIKSDASWVVVIITDKSKPAEPRNARYRLTFDASSKLTEARELVTPAKKP